MPRRRGKDEDPGILARILYQLRVESGLTQTQVAELVGWKGNSYYSDLERGDIRLPGKSKVADLERAFNKDPGYIENQLPRRDRFMRSSPAAPSASNDAQVLSFPSPLIRRINEHALDIANMDRTGKYIIAVERHLLNVKEEIIEELETTGESDQQDTGPGTIVPTA